MKAQNGNADLFLHDYLAFNMLDLEETKNSPLSDQSEVTTAEALAYVEEFLKSPLP